MRFWFRILVSVVIFSASSAGAFIGRDAAAQDQSPTGATDISLTPVIAGLTDPTFVASPLDGTNRLFVAELGGLVKIFTDGALLPSPFLDATTLVGDAIGKGLYSIAFHPDYTHNGQFFVTCTAPNKVNALARFTTSADNPNQADPASRVTILSYSDRTAKHNGGMLAFGRDGYLYWSTGGGGTNPSVGGQLAQDLGSLGGKLLRLDVDRPGSAGLQYSIPESNPFFGQDGVKWEIWAYGLRNPWRFSFDRETGALYMADVGEDAYEEIDVQSASSAGGENYSWGMMEELHCYASESCEQDGLTLPIAEYTHADGCSITGGYVYHGTAVPTLRGKYIHGDYCSGIVFALTPETGNVVAYSSLLAPTTLLLSFGEDAAGEIYFIDQAGGRVSRLTTHSTTT